MTRVHNSGWVTTSAAKVTGGTAEVSGYLWSTEALDKAKRIAANTPGVSNVLNRMELGREGTRGGADTGH